MHAMKWYAGGSRFLLRAALAASISGFAGAGFALATDTEFPFDGELRLDADPMPGSKRVPSMDIAANGAIVLEMWCNRVEGQVIVAADTITVLTGQPTDRSCPPARAAADTDLLAALAEVTNWQRLDDIVMLTGGRTLRFRVPTN
jgi:META domain-containing protein